MQGKQRRLVAVGAAVALGLGVGATSAESSRFKIDLSSGSYTISCDASFAGTNGSPVTLTPSFTSCDLLGFPATVTQSAPSELSILAGPSGGWYGGTYTIPSGTVMTMTVILGTCTATISGPQSATDGISSQVVRARNVTGGIELNLNLRNRTVIASGCPFSSNSTGGMRTEDLAFVPGVTIP